MGESLREDSPGRVMTGAGLDPRQMTSILARASLSTKYCRCFLEPAGTRPGECQVTTDVTHEAGQGSLQGKVRRRFDEGTLGAGFSHRCDECSGIEEPFLGELA